MKHMRSLPRYLVVGGLCALLANAILIGFEHLGINYAVSAIVAFVGTLLLAYALHTSWTFGAERSFAGLVRYGASMAINLPISLALLFVLINLLALRMELAAPLATVIQTAFNYIIATSLIKPTSAR